MLINRNIQSNVTSSRRKTSTNAISLQFLIGYEAEFMESVQLIPGTCEWLLQNTAYKHWHNLNRPTVLWVTAGPGSGKTVLASFVVGSWD